MKLLKKLYGISSPSKGEKVMCQFIKSLLKGMKVDFTEDKHGIIYATKGESETYPCIVCHTDEVHDIREKGYKVVRYNDLMFAVNEETMEFNGIGADDKKHRPIMIHRAPFGSLERFVAVLLEHTGGKLPLWLTPDQVNIVPVSEKYEEYAKKVCSLLNNSDIRAAVDDRNETLGKRIRESELKRIPFLVIVGEKEMTEGTVSVRRQGGVDLGSMPTEDFVALVANEVKTQLS